MRKQLMTVAVIASITNANTSAQEQARLEEVVVTAQKYEQVLQDVPITVSVVSGDAFHDAASFNFSDLDRMTAGLEMQGNGNTQNITLRGIGTDLQGASQARVTTYLDGSYVPNQTLLFVSQFDIQRYEVLRGPQGTLYGKASPTGAINIHTNDPSLHEVEGNVSLSAGEYDLSNIELGISVPLVKDELAVRFSGLYNEDASHSIRNQFSGRSKMRTSGGRMTILWAPNDRFSSRLSYSYVENTPPDLSHIEGNGIAAEDREAINNLSRDSKIRIQTTILSANWDMDWATLVSQTLYARSTNYSIEDTDSTDIDEQTEEVSLNLSPTFNQELRLESLGNDRWDWMLGGFYQKTRAGAQVESKDNQQLFDFDEGFWIPGADTTDLTLNAASEDFALFSHNTFFLNDSWTLTLGARWTKERRSNVTENVLYTLELPLFDISQSFPLPDFISSRTYYDWTGTAKLQYDFTVDQMAYLTVDSGGKSGGQTLDLGGNIPEDFKDFDDESSTSLELGYKAKLMQGRMSLNAALYYTIYQDFQLNAVGIEFLNGGEIEQVTFVDNADEVVAQGAELELQYQLTPDWFAGASVAYNDTRFEDYKGAPCNTGTPGPNISTCDRSDERLGGASSEWSTVLSTEYQQQLGWNNSQWYIRGLYNFNSSRASTSGESRFGGFGTFDLFTGIRSMDAGWDIKLWVKNLTDKEAVTGRSERLTLTDMSLTFADVEQNPVTSSDTGYQNVGITRPRQVGATLSYRF